MLRRLRLMSWLGLPNEMGYYKRSNSGRLGFSLCVDLKSSLPPFQPPTVRCAIRPCSPTSRSTMARSRGAASIVTPPSPSSCRGLPGTSLRIWAITSARLRKRRQVDVVAGAAAAVRAPGSFRQSDARPPWKPACALEITVQVPVESPASFPNPSP